MPEPKPPGPNSLRRLIENTSPPRRPVEAYVLDLDDLPVVEVPPPPNWQKVPTSPPSHEVAQELVMDKLDWGNTSMDRSIGIRDPGLGFIQIGWRAQPLHPTRPQGVYAVCGVPNRDTGGELWRKAQWQFIKPAAGGAIAYEEAEAWFSFAECKAYVMRRMKTLAYPTAGGLAYVFRTVCPACRLDERDLLHVITPNQDFGSRRSPGGTSSSPLFFGSIEHVTLPLHLGTTFMTAQLRTGPILRFRAGGAQPARTSSVVVTIHLTQGAGDPRPVAMAYVQEAPGI